MRPRTAVFPFHRLLPGLLRGEGQRLQLALDMSRLADIVRIGVPGKPRYILTHPDDIRHVLQTARQSYRKSRDYRVLQEFMGEGIVTSEEPKWSEDRRLLQPSFSQSAAIDFRATMQLEAAAVAERWSWSKEPVDIFADTMRLTIAVIGQRLFSDSLRDDAEAIQALIALLSSHIFRRSQAMVDFARWWATPSERRAREARRHLAGMLTRHLGEKNDNVVAVLRQAKLTAEQIIDHVITLFAAGYETTGNALGWCLYTLAKMPALQAELANGSDPAALIKETLRHFPTVPGAGREAVEADVIGGVPIAAGSTLLLFFYGLHHREDFWRAANDFEPSRFATQSAYAGEAYLPFGAGPRVCVGSHFAVQEMSVALSAWLPRFSFSLADAAPVTAVPGISLHPSRPIKLLVSPR